MKKTRLTQEEIKLIISLRKRGNTLSDIIKIVPKAKSTIHSYIKEVIPYNKFRSQLAEKRYGTKRKAEREWLFSKNQVKNKIGKISGRDLILIAGMLYWGEGNKNELNLINSDSDLIRVFIKGLLFLGVDRSRIKISLRLFSDIDEKVAKDFWLSKLGLNDCQLGLTEWRDGKKSGKLPYGMCRLRVIKGGLYFKQLISIIDLIKMLS